MQQSLWPAPSRSWHSPSMWHRRLSGLSKRVRAQKLQKETEVWMLWQPPVSRNPSVPGLPAVSMLLHWSTNSVLTLRGPPLRRHDQIIWSAWNNVIKSRTSCGQLHCKMNTWIHLPALVDVARPCKSKICSSVKIRYNLGGRQALRIFPYVHHFCPHSKRKKGAGFADSLNMAS